MKDNKRKSTATFKLRRRTLYTNKATKQARKELQEAPSYGSNIALNLDPTAQLQKGPELTVLNKINFDECKAILKDCEALLANLYTKYKLKLMGNARWVYHKVMVQIEYFYAKSKGHLHC